MGVGVRSPERLKSKSEGSTRLTYTGLRGGLEHLKIETRLIDERFASGWVSVTLKCFFFLKKGLGKGHARG
jgi:hypothetical protein